MTISTSAQLTAAKRSNLNGRSASTASFLIAALAARAWPRQPNNCDGAISANGQSPKHWRPEQVSSPQAGPSPRQTSRAEPEEAVPPDDNFYHQAQAYL